MGGASRVKSKLIEIASDPSPQVPFVNGDDLRLVPALAAKKTEEVLLLISGLEQQKLKQEAPHPLISPPDLVIAPDRDARYRPPSEITREVLDRIAQRASLAKLLPATLVVVAHPDDEAIGAGGLLAGLPDAVVAHVTDGAPRDERYAQSKGFQTREEYARARRREVANALSHVGITPERIRGLGYVDGEASLQLLELVSDVADLMDEVRPDLVVTHPYEGGHSDHDATAFAVHLACGILRRDKVPTPVVFELTSYHNYSGTRRVFNFLPFMGTEERVIRLTEAETKMKGQMYEEFVSQKQVLERFPIGIERFRPAPRYLFTKAPHAGLLEYERACTLITGAEWRQNAGKALKTLRTRNRRFVPTPGLAQPFRQIAR